MLNADQKTAGSPVISMPVVARRKGRRKKLATLGLAVLGIFFLKLCLTLYFYTKLSPQLCELGIPEANLEWVR